MDDHAFTARSRAYLQKSEQRLRRLPSRAIAARVVQLVGDHDLWRGRECLNMNPAEGLMSECSRRLLASDMATRLTEGLPGDKTFPHYRANGCIDEIEAVIISLVRRQFAARFVEWRPVSTTMANAAVFHALLQPDDVVLAQSLDAGGNFAYQPAGPAGLSRARVVDIAPAGFTFEIDPDEVRRLAHAIRPRMIVIGGSKVLFPYPLRHLRAIADEVGATLLYDAAHLGLLISAGSFQRPLDEKAHIMTVSTHKSLGGPVGGLVLTNDEKIASRIARLTFPGLLQTRDQNKYAALAMTLAELEEFGTELAARMVSDAQALAAQLAARGFTVLARNGAPTQTHQVFLDLGARAAEFERRCQAAGILIPDCALTGDVARNVRTGARIGTHEVAKLGMSEGEMIEVADLVARASATANKARHTKIAADVRSLRARFPHVRFGFDHMVIPEDEYREKVRNREHGGSGGPIRPGIP